MTMQKRRTNGQGTIYNQRGIYYVQFTINGKRRKRSLKTGNYKEAEENAKVIMDQVHGTKDISDVVKTVAIEKGLVDKGKIRDIEEVVESTVNRKVLLKDSWRLYEEHPDRPDSGPATMIEYKRYWKSFINWVEECLSTHHYKHMHQISETHARSYASVILNKKGRGASTYNKYIRFCRLCFKVLGYDGGVKKNPFEGIMSKGRNYGRVVNKGVAPSSNLADHHHVKRNLEPSEILRLLETIDDGVKKAEYSPELKILFHIGLYTGLRLKDACMIRWENINFENNTISLRPAKTIRTNSSKWIHLPIIPCLLANLQAAWEMRGDVDHNPYVIPNISRLYGLGREKVSRMVSSIFIRAGIQTSVKLEEGMKAISIVNFHSLRYTFVSECAKAGVPLAVVQALVGHNSLAITYHYTSIDMDSARCGMEKLGEGFGG